jgi:Xaa-Pro aminopeptidase
VLYLSGYEPYFGDCMMVLPFDEGTETVLVKDAPDYFPQTCTWITDLRGAGDSVGIVREFLAEHGLDRSRVGIAGEYSMSPALFSRLQEEAGPTRLESASDLLERERSIKSDFEIACMREAAAIAEKGFEAAAGCMRPGLTEAAVKGEMERACREHGSQAFPHYTMVVSGADEEHTSWWWQDDRRRLQAGDPVIIDFGTMYRGYCCDLARPFVLGRAPARLKEALEVALDAQHAAAAAARPGVRTSAVMAAAVGALPAEWADQGWWGLGHGVGLEVHEWPFIGCERMVDDDAYEDRVLEESMVISLEPTVVLPNVGEIQIEDQFVVTAGGGLRLNDLPHQIVEV